MRDNNINLDNPNKLRDNLLNNFDYEVNCMMCTEGGILDAKLQCGHSFHLECVQDLMV